MASGIWADEVSEQSTPPGFLAGWRARVVGAPVATVSRASQGCFLQMTPVGPHWEGRRVALVLLEARDFAYGCPAAEAERRRGESL